MPAGELRWRRRGRRIDGELSRRQFMQLVSAAAAASLADGCQPDPPEQILPYVRRPGHVVPGKSTYYATSLPIDGYATGLLVATREGRPIKVEGNPAHPASLGATGIFHQAAVLQLYDPDRAGAVLHTGLPSDWTALERWLRSPRSDRGAGLRLLLEPTSSPLVHAQLARIAARYPACQWTFYSSLDAQNSLLASTRAFGRPLVPQYDLTHADVLVTFDSDLLSTPYDLRYAREFAARRHVAQPSAEMNRLYAVDSALSPTSSLSDHRLRRPSRRIGALVRALVDLVSEVRHGSLAAPKSAAVDAEVALDEHERRFLRALAHDLNARGPGRSLILAGDRQPAAVHVLCHLLNAELGNLGHTLRFTQPARLAAERANEQALSALVHDMQAGTVDTLLVLGANPTYDAPADLDWSGSVRRVRHSLCQGLYVNETAHECRWFAPLAHPFESWGDARAYDGTYSFIQPLIRPMRAGRTLSELLGTLAGQQHESDLGRLRVAFGQARGEPTSLDMSAAERHAQQRPEVQRAFELGIARGLLSDTAFSSIDVQMNSDAANAAMRELARAARMETEGALELNLLASPTLHDGSFANVGWLLELPEPITKLTWDNAALMSPETARKLGIGASEPGDDDRHPVVELTHAGRSLRAPALCLPSHADDSISLWLGYGRDGAEQLARGVGVNAALLRTSDALHFASGLRVHVLPERYPLAITQPHTASHERPIALTTTLAAYRANPEFTADQKGPLPTFMPEISLPGPQWAMTLDMSMCNGCSACMVACQAENNLLVVGKEQVRRGRVMHWLRIDVYTTAAQPERVVHQPMLCQHCENAPCEYVCPVNATEHSPDGLNEMVYNRCVGTRFCSNNCPYKVRRFNWFDWSDHEPANQGSVELQRNPEVSVRGRGVMEKCSYCVQRIRAAEIDARIEQREIRAGEVVTACQQACPARAITFDSLTHEDTTQAAWRKQARSYAALHETGARPRTLYLARIDNPNPELA